MIMIFIDVKRLRYEIELRPLGRWIFLPTPRNVTPAGDTNVVASLHDAATFAKHQASENSGPFRRATQSTPTVSAIITISNVCQYKQQITQRVSLKRGERGRVALARQTDQLLEQENLLRGL